MSTFETWLISLVVIMAACLAIGFAIGCRVMASGAGRAIDAAFNPKGNEESDVNG